MVQNVQNFELFDKKPKTKTNKKEKKKKKQIFKNHFGQSFDAIYKTFFVPERIV